MADGDREVLSSLPRTRPERRSAKRGARSAAGAAAAKTAAKVTPKAPAGKPKPRAKPRTTARSQPTAVPPRKIPPAGYAVPKQGSPVSAGGGELVGTAIQAVGELANLGTRALRDVLGRLPRP
jgi:hypothetical protein